MNSFALRRPVYRLLRALLWPFIWLVTGWRVEGLEHVPPRGPLLVASNHLSDADPFFIAAAMPRPVAYMAKIELFSVPVLSHIIRCFGAFPVERGAADRQAIRTALDYLAHGLALGIFPEGTRSRSRTLARGQPGISLLAQRSEAVVLPVGIVGSERLRLWPRPTIVIRIGHPIYLDRLTSGRLDHQAVADHIMTEIAALLPPAYRGVYAAPPATVGAEAGPSVMP